MDATCSVSQRRSYNGDLCTIRYIGKVEGTSGEWLGVEWDDATRGKHSGEHQGVRYFTCRRKQPTAGSFVRPSRAADKPRGFLEALREKYAPELEQSPASQKLDGPVPDGSLQKPIEISGKVVEEVGFDKIRKQLAELQELKIVLLDGLRVVGTLSYAAELKQIESACREIEQTCPKITILDLSRNLLTSWTEVMGICDRLRNLKVLKLNGNRLDPVEGSLKFAITELHLDDTLLAWDEISTIPVSVSNTITTLNLEHNEISSLSSIMPLTSLSNIEHLSLRGNCIDAIHERNQTEEPIRFSPTLKSVDLSRNQINMWSFVDELQHVFPGLQILRISGNPLYDQAVGPSAITGMPEKPMTVDEAYMLTLSRLSSLLVLNFGNITAKDRSNGELYYLSLVGRELSAAPETAKRDVLARHPRYSELCHIHGEPIIKRASDSTGPNASVNPRSVAARLLKIAFHLPSSSSTSPSSEDVVKVKEIPRSFDTYQVKAIVSRLFGLPPYECRLIWETDEMDPVSKENMGDIDGWDSEEEGSAMQDRKLVNLGDSVKFAKREVELVDCTKDIGYWFEADLTEARVRVEVLSRS
ncbi:hypothetical protein EYZ11_001582 [Aspergillus tanneri]|uniref:CAP-Gly domain-containing protein n=1 Tax=Aspergillus tanneri TaxID=1220188 RepID=A0A4S3JT99_9EURO|nr:hypothetical protein EYZ11_001582 [Aspergillus tanneri]